MNVILKRVVQLAMAFATVPMLACGPGRGGMVPMTVMFAEPPRAAPLAMPDAQASPGAPRIHVALPPNSSQQVELQELRGVELRPMSIQGPDGGVRGMTAWSIGRPVCGPPCGRIVDGRHGQEFYFAGPGVSESAHFTLTRETGDLFFTVRPGHAAAEKAGTALTGLGAAGVVVSTAILIAASTGALRAPTQRDPAVVVGVSSAVLGAGLALLLAGRTTFTVRREAATRQNTE